MPRRLSQLMRKFQSIHVRYRTPRIGMTPAVRTSLLLLRMYLLLLVALMLYKFVSLVMA